MRIEIALKADAEALADFFIGHITAHPEYISHGEIQMGVGEGGIVDGVLVARPAPDAREKWMKYILEHIEDTSFAEVWKVVSDDGAIQGFCVADIEEDGDAPFGMVCDVLVKEDYRGHGAGEALLQTAISWLRSSGVKDIYLESGKNNHSAHRFFEKRGFTHISEIYKLS
ncbi:MAG: GNAT family N-acetyltransferase [Bacteroidales bacterium]|nr:GNAT family N-acetyltransferase [Bacteroidales bacterium]